MYIGKFKLKNPLILAPMAGVSQMPFRRLALKCGAALAPTELISAKGLYYENLRTKTYLTYDKSVESPFCVQLFGGEDEAMAIAAYKAMSMGADIIDINMGCPVKKVTKTNAGSALLCDVERAKKIVLAMRKRTEDKIPITVKIRSGWDYDSLNFITVAKTLEDAGIAGIALHARTRAQGYTGSANWEHISMLKQSVKIPVVGNGDVKNLSDAQQMIKQTGCDAVMIGRAALGNPWVFSGDEEVSLQERYEVIKEHFLEHLKLNQLLYVDNPDDSMAVKSFRSHLIWYSRGLRNGALFRQEVMKISSINETLEKIEEFFLSKQNFSGILENYLDESIDYRQAFG